LRARKEDIPVLIDHFSACSPKNITSCSRDFQTILSKSLLNYEWPGNVRELRNVMEKAVMVLRGGHEVHQNLPERLTNPVSDRDTSRSHSVLLGRSGEDDNPKDPSLVGNNKSEASRIRGVTGRRER